MLTKSSYEPITATKWTDAIDAITHSSPDLILLDLKMPTIHGTSILGFIRNKEIELPVIVVSGYVTEEVTEELQRHGVSGIIR